MFRETENEKKLSVATMDTISLKGKEISRGSENPDGYHGYHERSRDEFGLQMDSTEALFRAWAGWGIAHKSMKLCRLSVVARDGIEPPTLFRAAFTHR